MAFEEELKVKNEDLNEEYVKRVKEEKRVKRQEKKAKVIKIFHGVKRGVMAIILSPYKAVKAIKKYTTKKKLERETCLKEEKALQLARQEGKNSVIAMYDKSKIGKRETERSEVRINANNTTEVEKTIVHTENGPMLKVQTEHKFTNPSPYYGWEQEDTEICYQGYIKLSDKKGKEEIIYVEASYNSTGYDNFVYLKPSEFHKACYTKDGETFIDLDPKKAKEIFEKFDKSYKVEYRAAKDISNTAETTK